MFRSNLFLVCSMVNQRVEIRSFAGNQTVPLSISMLSKPPWKYSRTTLKLYAGQLSCKINEEWFYPFLNIRCHNDITLLDIFHIVWIFRNNLKQHWLCVTDMLRFTPFLQNCDETTDLVLTFQIPFIRLGSFWNSFLNNILS